MNRTTQFRWLMTMLALVAALVVAGTALGGVSEDAEPLEEPRVEETAIETPTPTATPTPCEVWVESASTQVGEIVEVRIWAGGNEWAGAYFRFDTSMLEHVDSNGNPARLVQNLAYGLWLIYDNYADNSTGEGQVFVWMWQHPQPEPFKLLRFRALRAGTATIDMYDPNLGECEGSLAAVDGTIDIAPLPTATPTETPWPTPTPSITPTPLARMVHGTVLDPAGAPVPNAALTLYRYSNTAWTQKAVGTSGADGVFRLWTNPIPGDWKLVVAPPAGYSASSAALPEGVSGQVISADTLTFELGDETGQVGAFQFVVAQGPTTTPTPSPQPTLPPVVLQGRVRWNGVGLAGVQVTLSPGGLSSVQTTVTDDEGYYAFVVDGAGAYVVSIHDPEGRVEDASRVVDTEVWEPGPIDWGQWEGWLPWVVVEGK